MSWDNYVDTFKYFDHFLCCSFGFRRSNGVLDSFFRVVVKVKVSVVFVDFFGGLFKWAIVIIRYSKYKENDLCKYKVEIINDMPYNLIKESSNQCS